MHEPLAFPPFAFFALRPPFDLAKFLELMKMADSFPDRVTHGKFHCARLWLRRSAATAASISFVRPFRIPLSFFSGAYMYTRNLISRTQHSRIDCPFTQKYPWRNELLLLETKYRERAKVPCRFFFAEKLTEALITRQTSLIFNIKYRVFSPWFLSRAKLYLNNLL